LACCSRRPKRRSSGRRPGRGNLELSVPKRITTPRSRPTCLATSRGRSNAGSGGATGTSAPLSQRRDGDARSGRSWSTTTCSLMRDRARLPLGTFRCAADSTTGMRRNLSSDPTALRRRERSSRCRPERARETSRILGSAASRAAAPSARRRASAGVMTNACSRVGASRRSFYLSRPTAPDRRERIAGSGGRLHGPDSIEICVSLRAVSPVPASRKVRRRA